MSLKTRLRLFTIALMISVISALSALYVYTLGESAFTDALQRANLTANSVQSFIVQRLTYVTRGYEAKTGSIDEYKQLWTGVVRNDPEIGQFLENLMANSRGIVEIQVVDTGGHIVADSSPDRVGHRIYPLPDFGAWLHRGPWAKLIEVYSRQQDYQHTIPPIGIPGQPPQPVFTIRVILSSSLLRQIVLPQMQTIGVIFLGALLLSMLLAVVVSNLSLRPLANISQTIDLISRGELAKPPAIPDGAAREFAVVQSKLNLLGQQFHGARQDATQLRTNIEQLLERLEEVVFLFDRDDRLVMAGRAAERLLGRGRWEIMGRTLTELFPLSSTLGAAVRNAIELRQPLKDLPLTLERNGAASTRILLNVEMLEAFPDHQRIGTLITLRDAETRRQIQSQLDISARLAAISRLTGGVAHEIKNPLQAITVHLELLRSKVADNYDYVGPEIETISREIQRLDRVVKTFLDFTRPIELKMRQLDMVGLVREVASLVAPSAGRQNVQVEVDVDPAEIPLHGDRDLLQQAILNVVVNGVEAMKQGGNLKIEVRQAGEECVVAISDQGVGIPVEIRERIFNLYYSTKGKGSGIGLAMTFRVVQLHNGTIDFTSEPGQGTTFRLRFPAIVKEAFRGAYSAGEKA